jgi:MoxR-like ATPase
MAKVGPYKYAPVFDDTKQPAVDSAITRRRGVADRAERGQYVFDDEIRLRVNLAMVTGRPLLVRGPSGCGKSSLARAVAARTGWNYLERTVSSRTQAQDLLYEIDQLRRLQDAYQGQLAQDERPYFRPGPLYWAFDAEHASSVLRDSGRSDLVPKDVLSGLPWVVLLDEIDKADPDVPNNLLVPLGTLEFAVPELGTTIRANADRAPLVILTTNEERELPPAFLRRCVELVIGEPSHEQLVLVGMEHKLGGSPGPDAEPGDLGNEIDLDLLATFYEKAPRARDQRRNSAEFLDFVRAWRHLEIEGDEATRKAVLEAISGQISGS